MFGRSSFGVCVCVLVLVLVLVLVCVCVCARARVRVVARAGIYSTHVKNEGSVPVCLDITRV